MLYIFTVKFQEKKANYLTPNNKEMFRASSDALVFNANNPVESESEFKRVTRSKSGVGLWNVEYLCWLSWQHQRKELVSAPAKRVRKEPAPEGSTKPCPFCGKDVDHQKHIKHVRQCGRKRGASKEEVGHLHHDISGYHGAAHYQWSKVRKQTNSNDPGPEGGARCQCSSKCMDILCFYPIIWELDDVTTPNVLTTFLWITH